MSEANKTSDKNVRNIEKDIERCKKLTEPQNANWIGMSNQKAIGHLISHYKNMKFNYENLIHDISLIAESLDMQEDSTIEEIAIRISEEMYNQQQINEEHQKINGELRERVKELEKYTIHLTDKEYRNVTESAQRDVANDSAIAHKFAVMQQQIDEKDKRIQELEEENKKLKAQHVFTRNEATDEEKAELYDAIDKTLDTFLEKEKPIWQQEMKTNKMSLVEALNIVDSMYQDRYKIVQENNTIYADRLKDVKFTNLEFASVRLLREVLSLQSKLKNSIPKQVVINTINDNGFEVYTKEYGNVEVVSIDVLQELLEGGNENG